MNKLFFQVSWCQRSTERRKLLKKRTTCGATDATPSRIPRPALIWRETTPLWYTSASTTNASAWYVISRKIQFFPLLKLWFVLQVKRYSYTTSTENMTSTPKLWGLERNCTSKCEPGCIVIGERTKLYACTSCCEKSLCNSGTGNANELVTKELEFFFALSLQLLLAYALKPSSWH